jgi:hypothetical protein
MIYSENRRSLYQIFENAQNGLKNGSVCSGGIAAWFPRLTAALPLP